jgi:hypothetical protein
LILRNLLKTKMGPKIPAYRLARYFSQSVQPVNSLYFSMTFTAAFLIPKSICVPTAFDGEMR